MQELENSIMRNLDENILFSGGLDSTIVAYLSSKHCRITCFTASLGKSEDLSFSQKVAKELNFPHKIEIYSPNEAINTIEEVIKALKCFDPNEILNGVTLYRALSFIKENYGKSVSSADGCDELFAGYRYMLLYSEKKLQDEIRAVFSERTTLQKIGDYLKIRLKMPFRDKKFSTYALQIPPSLKVREEKGSLWGKWILRKAFENQLPDYVVWRKKLPSRETSGSIRIEKLMENHITDTEIKKFKKEYNLNLNRKGYFCFKIYNKFFEFQPIRRGRICNYCGSPLLRGRIYCRMCGNVNEKR